MGIGRNGYYTLKDILKYNAKINWIYSNRNDGKSYAVKEYALKKSIKEKQPLFAIIRRNDIDIKPSKICDYFVERDGKSNLIYKVTKGDYDHVYCRTGKIYLAKYDEGKEIKSDYAIGEYFSISTATHYKSTGHKCKIIIAEEIITNDAPYLDNEPSKFMHLVSTICRDDDDVEIFLIGNNVNRISPYFKEWGITGIFKQKIGTIDIYNYEQIDGDVVKIAVEYVPPRPNKKSGLFVGKAEKSIQGGQWETYEFPHLYKPFKEFELIDMITYKTTFGQCYTIALIYDDEIGAKFCYIYPAKHICDRVLTSEFSTNPLHTPRLKNSNSIDISIHNCYINNKFMFSDNLTGTDFVNTIKAEKQNPFL